VRDGKYDPRLGHGRTRTNNERGFKRVREFKRERERVQRSSQEQTHIFNE
jgi:hypothetical protein